MKSSRPWNTESHEVFYPADNASPKMTRIALSADDFAPNMEFSAKPKGSGPKHSAPFADNFLSQTTKRQIFWK